MSFCRYARLVILLQSMAAVLPTVCLRAQIIQFDEVSSSAHVNAPPLGTGYGHGVAIADFTGDRRPDIYLVVYDAGNFLFRYNGHGTFSDISAQAGVRGDSQFDRGVAAADYDNDGDTDIYVAAAGGAKNMLFRNLGNGKFKDVARFAGLENQAFEGQGISWGDYDNDGDLDVFLASYNTKCTLFLQNANHVFGDSTIAVIDSTVKQSVQAVSFDVDLDGDLDIFVSRGAGFPNRLYLNQGNGTFVNESTAWNLDDPAPHGQGVTVADYDRDGDFDIYMCNSIGANRLYRNEGTSFREVARFAGVQDTSRSLGCVFADFNNDGWPDLYVGNIGRNHLYRNIGDGTFADETDDLELKDPYRTYGLCSTDYNGDGKLDLFFSNSGQPSVLLKNIGQSGHWLGVDLEGTVSNRDGIGARVMVDIGGLNC